MSNQNCTAAVAAGDNLWIVLIVNLVVVALLGFLRVYYNHKNLLATKITGDNLRDIVRIASSSDVASSPVASQSHTKPPSQSPLQED